MKSKILTPLVVMFSMLNLSFVYGQEISMEQTLNYLNNKFGGVCQIDVLRGVVVARYFDGGELIREDQVLCKDLNLNSMYYDKGSRIFAIDCNSGRKCVDRQLFIRKIQRDYNRISFPVVLDAKGEQGMKNAMTHMIKLVLDSKYSSSTPFE
jgi:hypothetical protein